MWPSWREATQRALYGAAGFYRRSRPEWHFRTSAGASSVFAAALATLLRDLDAELGHPECLDVVDVGAGSGRLLEDIATRSAVDLRDRLRLTAVELGSRPDRLAPGIAWTAEPPGTITGLVIANEWLDNVPVDVVELAADGPRLVLVDPATGAEQLGGPPEAADLAWLRRWWPLAEIGDRAEVGRPRDEAWAGVVRRLRRGLAIAVDYIHHLDTRPTFGTLTGYRAGRQVAAVPDGSCDITTHVALDSCADAGQEAGATDTMLTTQRDALRALGILGRRPHMETASTNPDGYLHAMRRAGEEAELIDLDGLGGFGWLVQSVGGCLPARLAATMVR